MYIRDRSSSRPVAYTEVFWDPGQPELIEQGDTAVLPVWRGRGFAKWLKAAMLQHMRKAKPQARWIRTTNADSNAVMLRINEGLGFKPFTLTTTWQVGLSTVLQYLRF
jgi:GNAT superfamily N-acetyltransferase